MARKLSPGNFGLLQQYRHYSDLAEYCCNDRFRGCCGLTGEMTSVPAERDHSVVRPTVQLTAALRVVYPIAVAHVQATLAAVRFPDAGRTITGDATE
jgi:hypothetical protein